MSEEDTLRWWLLAALPAVLPIIAYYRICVAGTQSGHGTVRLTGERTQVFELSEAIEFEHNRTPRTTPFMSV